MGGHGRAGFRITICALLLVAPSYPIGWPFVLPIATGVAAAQDPRVDIEVGASREVLTDGQEPWEDYWVRATVRPSAGIFVYGGVRQTQRFGEEDRQWEAGAGLPVAERWSLRVDGTWSGTHRAVPRWSASGSAAYRMSPDWTASVGGGHQVWDRARVNHQWVGVDRHFSRVSIGYRLGFHQVDPGGSGIRHSVSGSGTYGDRGSSVTLGLAIGRDATIVGLGEIRDTTERSARVSGTHWLDARTGVSYTFGIHRHGSHFTRSSSSVGIRRRL